MLPRDVAIGDAIVGIASPGLRCNGYSLARRALLERAGRALDGPAWSGATTTLADELLRPSVIYAPVLAALRTGAAVHAFAHITGGGLAGNLNRILPSGADARISRTRWREPEIFGEVQRAGDIEDSEMESVFNLGIGMGVVVPVRDSVHAVEIVRAMGHDAWVIGEIVDGTGVVRIERT